MTFHYKLIELEAERVALQQSRKGFADFPVECSVIMEYVEQEVGVKLADVVPKDWQGWLYYRRSNKESLTICRGRAFKVGGITGKTRAGLDLPILGLDAITEYQRGFDVSPPQELDHLLINFGGDQSNPRVFLWYGENIAPYKLIFADELTNDPHNELSSAIVEACSWILKRPKHLTLNEFLKTLS